jgi:hypothetical protein
MFPVRYELNSYILFRRNSVFKGLILDLTITQVPAGRRQTLRCVLRPFSLQEGLHNVILN